MSLETALASWPDVDTAWLFGSRATGRARADSDFDVALIFARTVTRDRAPYRRGRIADDLAAEVAARVDVVDMERVAPITFVIIHRQAKLLIDRDPMHRVRVVCQQYAMWNDMQPHYAMQAQAVRAYFT